MQERPICFGCDRVVEYDPVYEAPCGHHNCCSAVFHGLCLMEWRERRDEIKQKLRKMMDEMTPYDE